MAKTSGIGDHLLVSGYDVSGDIGSVSAIQMTFGEQNVTAIDAAAMDRRQLISNGNLGFNNFFNDSDGGGAEARGIHDILTADKRDTYDVTYIHGNSVGSYCAHMRTLRFGYSLNRGASGSLLGTVNCSSTGGVSGEALQDAVSLTPGIALLDDAEEFADYDLGSADARSWLQLIEFDGTDATIKLQHRDPINGWLDLATLWDSSIDDPPPAVIVDDHTGAEDDLRVAVETTSGFSALRFHVSVAAI